MAGAQAPNQLPLPLSVLLVFSVYITNGQHGFEGLVCWGTAVTGGTEGLLTDGFLSNSKLTDDFFLLCVFKTFPNNLDFILTCKSNIQMSL